MAEQTPKDQTNAKAEPEKKAAKTIDELLAEWPSGDDDDKAEDKEIKAGPAKNGNGADKKAAEFDPTEIKAFMDEFRRDKAERQEVDEELRSERKNRVQDQFVKGIKAAVEDLKDADGDLILGLGLVEFDRNPSLERAWNERRSKPKQWREVLGALGAQIASRIPKAPAKSEEDEDDADDKHTDDATRRLAARAAGRTTTTSRAKDTLKEEDARVLAMNPREFADHVFKTTRVRI